MLSRNPYDVLTLIVQLLAVSVLLGAVAAAVVASVIIMVRLVVT